MKPGAGMEPMREPEEILNRVRNGITVCQPALVSGSPAEKALCRASFYRLLAAGYACPNGDPLFLEEAMEAAPLVGSVEVERLTGELADLPAEAGNSRVDAHARLFGFGGAGEISLYETEHVGQEIFRKSRDLADITGFYRAFGMEINSSDRERVDHLSVEAEFLSWLCAKQAVALFDGMIEEAGVCREAEARFLKDHFLRWVPGLAARIAGRSDGFYRTLSLLTVAFLSVVSKEEEAS
ncbi:MAG: molecular chaperone TorD family protein [Nitrospirae bacterium]|nr:molecular chaperone TorD family protein [Nitrospirota bacterium]